MDLIDVLMKLKEQSCGEVDKSTLVDIRDVSIDTSLSTTERIYSFVEQIKNPYLFLYEDRAVRVSFTDTEVTFEERIKNYFEML
ncbi:MAG: hypothetical protein FWF78_03125 [Defluviitaleaceae bacterium]|nr:hypothetical protein [Defluviitaleaceae bacterium]